MEDQIGFKGYIRNEGYAVTRVTGSQESEISPPAGKRFSWGAMSESSTTLAQSLTQNLFPDVSARDLAAPAEAIRRHFLTQFHKHKGWELDRETICAYLDARGLLPSATAG